MVQSKRDLSSQHKTCAVCYVPTRPSVVMIPAKASCPPHWTREFFGYLMSGHRGHDHHRTMYECVDQDQESLCTAAVGNTNDALFYHVEAYCGSGLPCPPYHTGKELNCVVCTK